MNIDEIMKMAEQFSKQNNNTTQQTMPNQNNTIKTLKTKLILKILGTIIIYGIVVSLIVAIKKFK